MLLTTYNSSIPCGMLLAFDSQGCKCRLLLIIFSGHLQKLIFEKPPPNVRKIVLATNMAEASITINDVVFVVDCGKAKETTYDALNNTPCLLPSWISQASARQVSTLYPIHASLRQRLITCIAILSFKRKCFVLCYPLKAWLQSKSFNKKFISCSNWGMVLSWNFLHLDYILL